MRQPAACVVLPPGNATDGLGLKLVTGVSRQLRVIGITSGDSGPRHNGILSTVLRLLRLITRYKEKIGETQTLSLSPGTVQQLFIQFYSAVRESRGNRRTAHPVHTEQRSVSSRRLARNWENVNGRASFYSEQNENPNPRRAECSFQLRDKKGISRRNTGGWATRHRCEKLKRPKPTNQHMTRTESVPCPRHNSCSTSFPSSPDQTRRARRKFIKNTYIISILTRNRIAILDNCGHLLPLFINAAHRQGFRAKWRNGTAPAIAGAEVLKHRLFR